MRELPHSVVAIKRDKFYIKDICVLIMIGTNSKVSICELHYKNSRGLKIYMLIISCARQG